MVGYSAPFGSEREDNWSKCQNLDTRRKVVGVEEERIFPSLFSALHIGGSIWPSVICACLRAEVSGFWSSLAWS